MHFTPLSLAGAWHIQLTPATDARGSFTRVFDAELFVERQLETHFPQQSFSTNLKKGTLRGLHYQEAPHGEVKLVRCSHGALQDVLVDLRADSPTYLRHASVMLSAKTPSVLYLPAGIAHGFLTSEDDTVVEYHISTDYVEQAQRGLRWNDPKLGIHWQGEVQVISERDAGFALLD